MDLSMSNVHRALLLLTAFWSLSLVSALVSMWPQGHDPKARRQHPPSTSMRSAQMIAHRRLPSSALSHLKDDSMPATTSLVSVHTASLPSPPNVSLQWSTGKEFLSLIQWLAMRQEANSERLSDANIHFRKTADSSTHHDTHYIPKVKKMSDGQFVDRLHRHVRWKRLNITRQETQKVRQLFVHGKEASARNCPDKMLTAHDRNSPRHQPAGLQRFPELTTIFCALYDKNLASLLTNGLFTPWSTAKERALTTPLWSRKMETGSFGHREDQFRDRQMTGLKKMPRVSSSHSSQRKHPKRVGIDRNGVHFTKDKQLTIDKEAATRRTPKQTYFEDTDAPQKDGIQSVQKAKDDMYQTGPQDNYNKLLMSSPLLAQTADARANPPKDTALELRKKEETLSRIERRQFRQLVRSFVEPPPPPDVLGSGHQKPSRDTSSKLGIDSSVRTKRRRASTWTRGRGINPRIRAQMLKQTLSIFFHHVQPCSHAERFYCMNGGSCLRVGALDLMTCRCPIGYTGIRCELIDQEYIVSLLTSSMLAP